MANTLLKHKDFMRLWSAQIGSAFGSRITRTVLPIIAILLIDANPNEIAILSALSFAPGLIVAFFAGGFIDRNQKRPLLIVTDLVRAALIFSIPVAAFFGSMSMLQLYLVAGFVGAATALFQIADNAYLPRLVRKEQLVEANSKLEATDAVAEAAGPGIAGLLVSIITAPIALIVDGFTYLWSAMMLARITKQEPEKQARGENDNLLSDAIAGLKACTSHPVVGPILAAETLMAFFGGAYMTLYMIVGLRTIGLDPFTLGVIISLGGLGGFLGAMAAAPIANKLGLRRTLLLTLLLGLSFDLFIPLAATLPQYGVPLLALHQIAGDIFLTIFVIQALSLRQRVMDDQVLARANATFQLTTGIAMTTSALLAGPLTMLFGITTVLWVAAIGSLLALPIIWLAKEEKAA